MEKLTISSTDIEPLDIMISGRKYKIIKDELSLQKKISERLIEKYHNLYNLIFN